MSYLAIILVVVFLLSKKGNDGSLLSGLDLESISPLLNLFGVDGDILNLLKSDEIKNLASGNFDIKSLIPLVTSLFETLKTKESSTIINSENKSVSPEYLIPIKDVASAEIISTLGDYFN